MARSAARQTPAALPKWLRPQLTQLVQEAPDGPEWLHEIKFDGYRMHARLDRGAFWLLTRTGLDWTHKYPAIATAVLSLGREQVYLDVELCGVGPDAQLGPLGAARACSEVKFLTWTDDNLLRQLVYEGLREDKPATEVRRPVPHPKPSAA
jgi:ATP-dependent DNA ligase